ncbi:hypothetical protein GOBAR_AA10486 [Gossypium barbadense]|uniref:DUF4283 domain-containing protein n=1 Tax=Gossypium barbadense TaxID=3634 RepID=A0A2P5Y3N0_GOSBA|nr:hypothetical protein GOBAR_AA10486 [Gossypium barbadense]
MARTIIVKLLGGKIGFNVLWNKITLLWNPKCPVQLMDLENNFFLVRFQDENNYNKALIGGPWVIFRRYLTVSPWSPDFSTSQSAIETVIGQTVGPVVKLGVHTYCARRGRGWRRSPLALRWCWIDEKGEAESQGEERNGCSDGAFGGSRFAMLRDLRGENFGDVDGKIDGEMEERNQGQVKGVGDNGVLGLEMTKRRSMDTKAKKWAKGKGAIAGHGVFDDGSKLGLMGATDQGKNIVIQPVDVSLNLNKEKHTAVHIMERKNMNSYNDKENEMFRFGEKSSAFQELQSRVHNIISGQQGRPSDEMIGNHLHDSVELKSVMKGLVCELERTPEKTLMEGDSRIVKERMVVEDALNEQ